MTFILFFFKRIKNCIKEIKYFIKNKIKQNNERINIKNNQKNTIDWKISNKKNESKNINKFDNISIETEVVETDKKNLPINECNKQGKNYEN